MSDEDTELPVRILLVDDHEANLDALEVILDPLRQRLVKARSGEQALRTLIGEDFAVILLDIQMQGLDGFATAKLIRQRERSQHTPIIFLTAYDNDPNFPVAGAYALGAVDYLVKPLVPGILLSKVTAFVELFRLRKRAEVALRDSEWLKRSILESALDCIITIDHRGRILEFNPAAERTFGYRRSEAIGQELAELIIPPQLRDRHRQSLAHHQAGGEGSVIGRRVEMPAMRADGSEFPAELAITRIPADPPIFTAYLRDITERKRAEAALKENDERKDEFLAMLAHELRNPIASISNAVTLLRMAQAEEHRAWSREVIERQVGHLARLIDDLLDVSRITRAKVILRKDYLDAANVLDAAAEGVRPLIEERKHTLTLDYRPGLMVEADPTRLEQIVINLLTNAAKYTEGNGEIRLSAGRQAGQVVIRIEDTGVGIPPEILPKMFDLFAQSDRSLARSEGGLGIGLTLVKRLTEMHGGTVSAESQGLGKGSTFTVSLPAAAEHQIASGTDRAPAAGGGSHAARILIVDDNRDTARTMGHILRLLGHDVKLAHSGPDAIVAAREHRPRFVLLDIGLPGMDGFEVARRLRREECGHDVVMIAVTGYGQEEDRRRSRAAGFDHHLVKPIDHNALITLLTAPVHGP
jgi:PAS domain S-box-containing protein